MSRLAFVTVSVAAALSACAADDDGPIDPEPTDGALVIGGADDAGEGFVELVDGDEATLIPGAQGGFHVWMGLEVTGVAGDLRLYRDARRVDSGDLVLRALGQLVEVPEDAMVDWWRKPVAVPSFMCPSPIGVQVFDREIEYRVWLTDDEDNVVAEDSITLTPRCPEGDQYEFCLEICSG